MVDENQVFLGEEKAQCSEDKGTRPSGVNVLSPLAKLIGKNTRSHCS